MSLKTKGYSQRVASKTNGLPVAVVRDHKMVSEAAAQVLVTFSCEPRNAQEAKMALAKAFDNKLSVVESSFIVTDKSPYTGRVVAVGYVVPNCEVMPLTEDVKSRMREMSSNILMDDQDKSLWKVSTSASGESYITRQFKENLSELVSIASVHDKQVRNTLSSETASIVEEITPHNAQYVAFLNTETASVDYGYVVTANSVFSTDSFTVVAGVEPHHVIQACSLNGQDYIEEIAKQHGDLNDAQNLKNYYEELCSNNPDFYVDLENQMEATRLV